MSQYTKSEVYRILRYKWTYLFIVICSGLLVSANIVLAAVKGSDSRIPYATTEFSLGNFTTSMEAIFFLCITVSSMLFGNEYINHTFKNSISFGISRGTIYISKLIIQVIYSLIAFSVITAIDIGSAYLLLEDSGSGPIQMMFDTILACMPLFLFALAASNFFLFMIENTWSSCGAMLGLMLVFPLVSNLLGMRFKLFSMLSKMMPLNLIDQMDLDFKKQTVQLLWPGVEGYRNYWLIGIIEMVILTILGYIMFSKKDIK